MIYILIWIIASDATTATGSAEFNDRQSCEIAMREISSKKSTWNNAWCFEKGNKIKWKEAKKITIN